MTKITPSVQRAMEDGGSLPPNVKAALEEARQAQQKLIKEGTKVAKDLISVHVTEYSQRLKQGVQIASKAISDIDHINTWSEVPGPDSSLSGFLGRLAKDTQAFNESVELARGALRARS